MDKKINFYDIRWMMSLFGTAVGAGILFLPIKAGTQGIYPIFIMALLAFPMAYLSHLALARFCAGENGDISEVSEHYFGFKIGFVITILYFFAFFPACIMYGVGITNTVISFMQHQMGLSDVNRLLVAFVLISALMCVMVFHEDLVIRVCEWLVYPLCAILLLFSLYLIPYWDYSNFSFVPSFGDFTYTIIFALPILAFAFEHTPAISTFSQSMERHYGKALQDEKSRRILFYNAGLLLFFIMFFVFSCVMSLTPQDLAAAKEQNIPIVSHFANKLNNPLIDFIAPLIAVLAISTSFFGHYFGAKEGLNGIIFKVCKITHEKVPNKRKIAFYSGLCFYVVMLVLSYLNPSILGIIDTLAGPVIAMILFLLPVFGFYKVRALKKYRNSLADIFIVLFGIATVATVIFNIF